MTGVATLDSRSSDTMSISSKCPSTPGEVDFKSNGMVKKGEVKVMRTKVRRAWNKHRRLLPMYFMYGLVLILLREPISDGVMFVWRFVTSKSAAPPLFVEIPPDRELRLVQVLFRHGHRSPFRMYPNDPNPRSLWHEGLGQLTKLGRQQHFELGKYLRQQYINYLTYDPLEVSCMSSSAERCLYGAYSLLAAMYPPLNGKRITDNLPWQPIPVQYTPEHMDKFLQSTNNCPASDREKKAMFQREEGIAFTEKYQDLYDFWSNKSGLNIRHYDNAGALFKTLCVQKTLNLVIPDWAEKTWDELSHQGDMCYYFHFRTKLLHRLRGGPLIGRILEKFRNKVRSPKHPRKLYLYSGHGSNIAAVLQALHLFNNRIPPYVASVSFELWEERNPLRHTIRILYSNSSAPETEIGKPRVLVYPGCSEFCPLEYLEDSTKDIIPLDWKTECLISDPIGIRGRRGPLRK